MTRPICPASSAQSLYPSTQVLQPVPPHVKIKVLRFVCQRVCPRFPSTACSSSFLLPSEPQPLTPGHLLLPCKNHLVGAQVSTEFSWTRQGRPGMPSTHFHTSHRTLHPSITQFMLSYVAVFTRLPSYLIARSSEAGSFLVFCMIQARSPVHHTILLGVCRPRKSHLELRREMRAEATEQLVKMQE